ncbi:MAG: response regulator [Nostocaceae cyanobacterium]|nr:response regulator [Nostocaceae cyanobacterium]
MGADVSTLNNDSTELSLEANQPIVQSSKLKEDRNYLDNNQDNYQDNNQKIEPTPVSNQNQEIYQAPPADIENKVYKIVCIDDSPTVLKIIKKFLDEEYFSVTTINNPLKALIEIIRSKPDLILLDISMPTIDGYELCSRIRKHTYFKNTPVIMVTGRNGLIDRARAKMVRSSGYLTKPFTQDELLNIISKHLS